ncbi:MAG: peptidase [Gammaproteobacteria bacterium]|nr:peptidase [Gammaproteobacteria bacterium]
MRGFLLAVVLLGGLLAQPAQARPPRDEPRQELRHHGPAEHLTPRQAARIAQERYGGRVLDVRPAERGYRVKLLKDGEVRVVHIADE